MPMRDTQLAVVRSWVGETVDEDTLNERYDRLRSFDAVVRETLRARLAVMVNDEPGLLVIDGLTINQGENMRSINELLREFSNRGGTGLDNGASDGIYPIVRTDRGR